MPNLKLFVVGESSGNPDEWRSPCGDAIVIAESAESALRMWPHLGSMATEVVMEKPAILHVQQDSVDHFRGL